ncbi:MAG: alcohol dehydrogenase catalytic domain-containing protein [Chloroflexota bacterium]
MMTAAVYHGPQDIRVEQVPRPEIDKDEVLVKVLAANICGTDLRIYKGGHRKYPEGTVRIPGHEVVGEIAEMGREVQGYTVGQRVFIAPNMGHSHDRNTISGNNNMDPNFKAIGINLDGAFAEYMRVPALGVNQGNLMALGDDVDPAEAACVEPLACVLRGQNAVNVHSGDVVVIMGAGPIGILHIMLANLRGATRVIVSEPSGARREQALKFGADVAVDPIQGDLTAAVMDASGGRGADVIITAAPAKVAQESALNLAAIGGRINFFGGLPKHDPYIQFNSNTVHYRELVVTGTTACSTYDCLRALELVKSGRLDLSGIVTRRMPLAKANEAFVAAADGTNLRVALEP